MASINGVSSRNMLSSLYNSANRISGLASGLDTEGMIESLVQSYQQKINGLNQKATKIEWQQEAYRSIISKMVAFTDKYTSYSSGTNLLSSSFFNNAMKVITSGKYADRVTASGKSDSEIVLNQVSQLATSARYTTTANNLSSGDGRSIVADKDLAAQLNGTTPLSAFQGSLSLTYGSKTVSINFDQVADAKRMDELKAKLTEENNGTAPSKAQVMAALINDKLAGQKITLNSGETVAATDRISVAANPNGTIVFTDKAEAGNTVYISGASGNVGEKLLKGLNLDNASKDRPDFFTVKEDDLELTKTVANAEYLSGKSINMSVDGVNRSFKLPEIIKTEDADGNVTYKIKGSDKELTAESYVEALGKEVDKAFGDKVSVGLEGGKLKFNLADGATNLVINTDVGEALGIGRTATSYLNTDKTLESLLGDKLKGLTPTGEKDAKGNDLYKFELNGVTIGNYSKDTKLSEIISDINENTKAGVKVSYSRTTGEFVFTARDTGAAGKIKFGDGLAQAVFGPNVATSQKTADYLKIDGLAGKKLSLTVDNKKVEFNFKSDSGTLQQMLDKVQGQLGAGYEVKLDETGAMSITKDGKKLEYTANEGDEIAGLLAKSKATFTAGQDSKFVVTVNGTRMEMSRSSNSVEIDGMTLNFKDEFTPAEGEGGVTFKSTSDADKIVDAVKSMIGDYNEMIGEIKKAYSTMPTHKTNGKPYEPLTDDERDGLSDSAADRYEEKAKQGILFGDSLLSGLYSQLSSVFFPAKGEDLDTLRKMGIGSSYSSADGSLTITLDEDKLRAMLDSDPEKVMEAFTKSTENGAATDGIMQNFKSTLDSYAKLTGEPKGLLIQHAGTPLSALSLLNNTLQDKIDSLNDDIETWQNKLSDQVDRYTSQFSRLEMLINQMNSQSSTLMGMMGG